MKMRHQQFRIGQLAKELELEKFVIRFWEKEFNIASHRSQGGQRFYEQKDVKKFKLIKELLYEKGFTIAGAKKILNEAKKKNEFIIGSSKTTLELPKKEEKTIPKELYDKALQLKKQLTKIYDAL